MLAELSIVPLGKDVHFSRVVAEFLKIVQKSGLDYELTAMGTIIEGDRDKVFDVIKECHEKALGESERVLTSISIDDFKGKTGRLKGKVDSVNQALKE